MTDLTKPVTRVTNVIDDTRGGFRKLVMRAETQGVRLRRQKSPTWTPLVPWKTVYRMAIAILRQEMLEERKRRKAERKAARR